MEQPVHIHRRGRSSSSLICLARVLYLKLSSAGGDGEKEWEGGGSRGISREGGVAGRDSFSK